MLAPDDSGKITVRPSRWFEEVAADTAKPPLKKVTRRFRRSAVRGRQIVDLIRKYRVEPDYPSVCPLVAHSRTSIISPKDPTIVKLPVWAYTDDWVKLVLANEALRVLAGSGLSHVSWSLNLGLDREQDALRHPKGLVDYMKRYLDRALDKRFDEIPLYWFCVHVTKDGRFHLHGGILVSLNQQEDLEAAMLHAGGKWKATKKDRHQLHLDVERCNLGWVRYAFGENAAVKRLLTGPTYTITGPLRWEAQWTYNKVREIMGGRLP